MNVNNIPAKYADDPVKVAQWQMLNAVAHLGALHVRMELAGADAIDLKRILGMMDKLEQMNDKMWAGEDA